MGKHKRSDKEYAREKRLSHENKQLKKELGRLRKILARADLDKYGQLKETIDQRPQGDLEQEGRGLLERLKQEWKCNGTPGCDGYLEITIFNKIDKTYYFRRCCSCNYRTKSQQYDPNTVQGIIKKTE